MLILGYALAALIGLSLGLMGGGGSILTVPIFVYVLGYSAKSAIAMSLPVVGTTSLVGALGHWRAGNVQLRTALIFGAIAMAGAYLGARLAVYVSGTVQLTLLAIVILVAATSMFRNSRRSAAAGIQGDANADAAFTLPIGKMIAVGLAVGILTGIVGIGGGFLIVPALVVLGRVPMKQAIGTSLLVIAMNSAAGFMGYLGQVAIPWGFLAGFTAVAIAGILVGTSLVRLIPAAQLKRGFSVFLVVIGAFMLYKNRAVFTRTSGAPPHIERSLPARSQS